MNDYVIRGMAAGNEIRFVAAYTRETVEKAREIHNTSPVCSAALGRLLTGGALMEQCARMIVMFSRSK